MRFKIRDHGADERLGRFFVFAEHAEQFVREKMRAEHGVGLEIEQVFFKLLARRAGKGARPFVQALDEFGIVGLAEKHTPEFRRVLNELNVAVRVNLFVQGREKFDEVNAVNDVGGM